MTKVVVAGAELRSAAAICRWVVMKGLVQAAGLTRIEINKSHRWLAVVGGVAEGGGYRRCLRT